MRRDGSRPQVVKRGKLYLISALNPHLSSLLLACRAVAMCEAYQRQTYALGREGASRLSHATALVVGMCGVGAETGASCALHTRVR